MNLNWRFPSWSAVALSCCGCAFDVTYQEESPGRIENCLVAGDEDGDGDEDCNDEKDCGSLVACCEGESCCSRADERTFELQPGSAVGAQPYEALQSAVVRSRNCVTTSHGMSFEFLLTRTAQAEGSIVVGLSSLTGALLGLQLERESLLTRVEFLADGSIGLGHGAGLKSLPKNVIAEDETTPIRLDLVPLPGVGKTLLRPRLVVGSLPPYPLDPIDPISLPNDSGCGDAAAVFPTLLGTMSGMRVEDLESFEGNCARPDEFERVAATLDATVLTVGDWAKGGIGEPTLIRVRDEPEAGWELFFNASDVPPSNFATTKYALGSVHNPDPSIDALTLPGSWVASAAPLRVCDAEDECKNAEGSFVEPTAVRTAAGEWLGAAAVQNGDGDAFEVQVRPVKAEASGLGYRILPATAVVEPDETCASLRDPELLWLGEAQEDMAGGSFVLYYVCRFADSTKVTQSDIRVLPLNDVGQRSLYAEAKIVLDAEQAGEFAQRGLEKPVVVVDNPDSPTEYRLWFVGTLGGERALGVARAMAPTGPFTSYSGNPVLTSEELDCGEDECALRSLTTSGVDADTGRIRFVVSRDTGSVSEFGFFDQPWTQPWSKAAR